MKQRLKLNNYFLQFCTVAGCCLMFFGSLDIFSNNYVDNFSKETTNNFIFKAKDTADPTIEILDISDVIRRVFNKKSNVNELRPDKSQKKVSLLVLPNVSYKPANGVLVGIAATAAVKLGQSENTHVSLINSNITFTTENQFIFFIKSCVYTKYDKFYLEGDWRYYDYSASTFGLGTNSPIEDFENHFAFQGELLDESTGEYPMNYNYTIFHQIANRKLTDNLYGGIGYHLDSYWNIADLKLDLTTTPKQLTPHYTYSIKHGFKPKKYTTSGVSLNLMLDSRDNQINPYKGCFAKINYRYNPEFLGSSKESSMLWTEFRTYTGLSTNPGHLLAFWFFGSFKTSGEVPYFTLMSVGGDKKARSGRGYIAGRYRGEDMLYGEIEYRFPILKKTRTLSGVVFLNAVTTSNYGLNEKLFDYVRPATGVGLRVLINKFTRLTVSIDFGIGYKSSGFYFAGGETF